MLRIVAANSTSSCVRVLVCAIFVRGRLAGNSESLLWSPLCVTGQLESVQDQNLQRITDRIISRDPRYARVTS